MSVDVDLSNNQLNGSQYHPSMQAIYEAIDKKKRDEVRTYSKNDNYILCEWQKGEIQMNIDNEIGTYGPMEWKNKKYGKELNSPYFAHNHYLKDNVNGKNKHIGHFCELDQNEYIDLNKIKWISYDLRHGHRQRFQLKSFIIKKFDNEHKINWDNITVNIDKIRRELNMRPINIINIDNDNISSCNNNEEGESKNNEEEIVETNTTK